MPVKYCFSSQLLSCQSVKKAEEDEKLKEHFSQALGVLVAPASRVSMRFQHKAQFL